MPLSNSSDEEDNEADLHSTALSANDRLPGASQQGVLASAPTDISPGTALPRPSPSVAVSTISTPDTFQPSSDVDAALIPNFEAGPTRVVVTRTNRLSRPRADRDFLYYKLSPLFSSIEFPVFRLYFVFLFFFQRDLAYMFLSVFCLFFQTMFSFRVPSSCHALMSFVYVPQCLRLFFL